MSTKQSSRPAGADAKRARNKSSKRDAGSGSASMDPRIQARRDEVAQQARVRQRRTIGALGAVTALAVGAMLLVQSSWMDVNRLVINGAVHSDLFAIQDLTMIEAGDPILEADLTGAAGRVQQLPWVQSAVVERDLLAGEIIIRIQERVATAAIPVGAGFVLVDTKGHQLEVVETRPPDFLPIVGIDASGTVGTPVPPLAQSAMRLVESIPAELRATISEVRVEDGGLVLVLVQGGEVLLGSDSGLSDKIVSLETMMSRVDLRCLFQIDLRVPSAPALTRVASNGVERATLTNLADCT